MAPIALTDAQLDQVMTQAHQVPRALRDMYLQAVAERLRGKPFDDADVWRAAVAAMREIIMKGARGRTKTLPATSNRRQFIG